MLSNSFYLYKKDKKANAPVFDYGE